MSRVLLERVVTGQDMLRMSPADLARETNAAFVTAITDAGMAIHPGYVIEDHRDEHGPFEHRYVLRRTWPEAMRLEEV